MKSWLVASWFLLLNLESWIGFVMLDLEVLNQSLGLLASSKLLGSSSWSLLLQLVHILGRVSVLSSLTAFHRSSPIFLSFCEIGLAWGQMATLWHMMLGWYIAYHMVAMWISPRSFLGLQLYVCIRGWWGPCRAKCTTQVWVQAIA